MARAIDILAIALLLIAVAAFVFGLLALERQDDFRAVYLMVIGAFSLRGSTEILRPRGATT